MVDLEQLFKDVLRAHGTGYLIDEFDCCAAELAKLFEQVDDTDTYKLRNNGTAPTQDV